MITRIDPRLIRFALIGVLATVVNVGSVTLLVRLTNDGWATPASVVGHALGILSSYLGNRLWTFRSSGAPLGEAARFLLIYGVIAGVNALIMLVVHDLMGVNYLYPLAATQLLGPFMSWFGSRLFVFRGAVRG